MGLQSLPAPRVAVVATVGLRGMVLREHNATNHQRVQHGRLRAANRPISLSRHGGSQRLAQPLAHVRRLCGGRHERRSGRGRRAADDAQPCDRLGTHAAEHRPRHAVNRRAVGLSVTHCLHGQTVAPGDHGLLVEEEQRRHRTRLKQGHRSAETDAAGVRFQMIHRNPGTREVRQAGVCALLLVSGAHDDPRQVRTSAAAASAVVWRGKMDARL